MTESTRLPSRPEAIARELVARLGPHPRRSLGLDFGPAGAPETDAALADWLFAACLLDPRVDETRAIETFRALQRRGLSGTGSLCEMAPTALEQMLRQADYPARAAQRCAPCLGRLGASLRDRWTGSLSRLAADASELDELAGRLAALAPGFGRAAVVRFLGPLRDLWWAASDLPLEPASRAAAIHTGLCPGTADAESGVGALRAAIREAGDLDLADLEAALGRLGRRACLRERVERCPLGSACPRAEGRAEPTS